ncbi:hypothetical protein PISMIDRAFT_250864 [Pisolithus microcarpus 441]|uniref:Uncharacterized protein n=1 Tax=Pisolithus microcarpus 441 TaxID=765257 RepID=A0A0C9Z2Y0_9AGAM|nr:hypothetical protein PISMIDRAFT_250864 [Pisolithus microcarpus 441]
MHRYRWMQMVQMGIIMQPCMYTLDSYLSRPFPDKPQRGDPFPQTYACVRGSFREGPSDQATSVPSRSTRARVRGMVGVPHCIYRRCPFRIASSVRCNPNNVRYKRQTPLQKTNLFCHVQGRPGCSVVVSSACSTFLAARGGSL